MNLISFFKPTIAKIIIAVIIFIIFVPFINYNTGIVCVTFPCPSSAKGSIILWLLFSYELHIYSVYYVNFIIGTISSYIASCIIVFAINKIKKK